MSARTLLGILAGIAVAGVLLVWLPEGPKQPLGQPSAAEVAEVPKVEEQDLVVSEPVVPLDARPDDSRAVAEEAPRFDREQPRTLPVVLGIPDGTPRGERVTVVLTAWKSDSEDDVIPRFWGEWTEVDRLEDVVPGPDLALHVPRDAQAVRVEIEAEYLYLPDRVELDDLDELAPLRLELELAGRLRFRLVPPASSALDASVLAGTEANLDHCRADVSFRTGSPVVHPVTVGEDLVVESGGLRPDYEYTLEGNCPPFAPYESDGIRPAPGETVEVEVHLIDGIEVHGRVLGPDGQLLPEARLWASFDFARGSGGSAFEVDERGEFHLAGLYPGLTELSASADGLLSASVSREELATGRVIEGVELRLRAGAAVGGTVLLPDGRPVSGASVQLREPGDEWSAHRTDTDEGGRFRITGLEAGEFDAIAEVAFDAPLPEGVPVVAAGRRRGAGGWRAQTAVSTGDEQVELRLVAPVALVGRAVDEDGDPVAKVQLTAEPDLGGELRIRRSPFDRAVSLDTENGTFVWDDLPPGRWVIRATAQGYSEPPPIRVELPADHQPAFVFRTRLQLTGRVLDATGAPVPGARLEGVEVRGGVHHLGAVNEKVDGEGVFELGLDASTYLVFATADGFAPSEQLELTLERGSPIEPVELILRGAGRLECELQDRSGRPVPGQNVQVEGIVSADWPSHETDAAGRLVIEGLAPGSYTLSAWIEGDDGEFTPLRTAAQILAGETTHVVLGGPLDVRLTVRGRVTSGDVPLSGWQVTLYPRDRSSSPARARTDERGRFEVGLEIGGTTAVTLQSDRGPTHRDVVLLPESGEHELTFELPTAGLRGRVTSVAGDLPLHSRAYLLPVGAAAFGGDAPLEVSLQEGGAFEALHLEPGTYVVVVGPNPFFSGFGRGDPVGSASRVVTLARGEVVEGIELRLPEAGVLEIDVVDEQGAPVAGAILHAYDSAGNRLTAEPIRCEGAHASISTLPLGEVRLVALTEERVSPEPIVAQVSADTVSELQVPTVLGAALELRLEAGVEARGLTLSVRDDSGWELSRGFGFQSADPTRRERSLRPLPPGRWTVRLTAPSGASTVQQVEVAAGEERVLDLETPD